MDMKRLAIGTIVGVVILQIVGYALFQVALFDFFQANRGSAVNAFREPAMPLFFALGDLAFATLLALALVTRATPTAMGGFVTGAVMGLLIAFGTDLVTYGYADLWNLTAVIVFPFFVAIQWGIAGAVIAAVLARVPKGAAMRAAE